jgi:putative addiction module component (TIGR02574 family)
MTTENIISAAMSLPPESKVKLARQLLDSLRGPDEKDVDEVWAVEIERRIDEYEAGKVQTIPAEQVIRPRA